MVVGRRRRCRHCPTLLSISSSLHVALIVTTLVVGFGTIITSSHGAFAFSSRRCCDFSRIRKSGREPMFVQQYNDDNGSPDDDELDSYCVQFSHAFQRHVVHTSSSRRRSGNLVENDDDERRVVVRSFQFLEEAISYYPSARVIPPLDMPYPPPSCFKSNKEEEEVESETTTIAGMGLWTLCDFDYSNHSTKKHENDGENDSKRNNDNSNYNHDAVRTLLKLVSSNTIPRGGPRHFFNLDPTRLACMGYTTSQAVSVNYNRVVNLLSSGKSSGSSGIVNTRDDDNGGHAHKSSVASLALNESDVNFVMQNFPFLAIYNVYELEALIQFMIQPLPDAGTIPTVTMIADRSSDSSANNMDVDWPSLVAQGYGAGLTVNQASKAVRMMPELLALYYEHSIKPSYLYMYNQMQGRSSTASSAVLVPPSPQLIEEATIQLNLEGTDAVDAYTFAYLHSIGVSWNQIRLLLSGLPLWRTVNLETGWEILARGPVRSKLQRSTLDYLRRRLQIGPSDVYRLLKTHTRLSTYNARNKILPTLDMLQRKLSLKSAELRKLILRMPSLVGMGSAAFEDRLDFFTNEVGMSLDDLKVAVMKQPSLLQYSIKTTLRPKLKFFVDELGIAKPLISRIIRTAPASMGLSLVENLRPKIVSIMKLCSLHPFQVGSVVSTSPQILLLSRKSKIEPTLKSISTELRITEPSEIGNIVLSTPRVLNQGLESSIATKIELLMKYSKTEKSRDTAIQILRSNPALLVTSNAVLEDRIERCPFDTTDLATWLRPTAKGRRKAIIQQSTIPTTTLSDDPIVVSSSPYSSLDSLDSVIRIYRNVEYAAKELDKAKSMIVESCNTNTGLDGMYYKSLSNLPFTTPREPPTISHDTKTIPISIFTTGGIYPSDSATVARGQRRTGGLAIQIFSDTSRHDKSQFLRNFHNAAQSCFGQHVPIDIQDESSKLIAVFPLVNPSTRRCELFACTRALRILEELLRVERNDDSNVFYDIKVYTDSDYVWKIVKSKARLLEIGSSSSSQEMLTRYFDEVNYSVNVDILYPLVRSFSRLNGSIEPADTTATTTQKEFINTKVEFVHSMDGVTSIRGWLMYVRKLKRQAKFAAMRQYYRERVS